MVVYDESETQLWYVEPVHIPAGASLSDALNGIDAEYVVLDGDIYRTDTTINVEGLRNVTIVGAGGGTQILADNSTEIVLNFKNCENITLQNIVIGHDPALVEPGSCTSGVLYFQNSNVTLTGCDLFGCGTNGFIAIGGEIHMERSVIRDCSQMILALNACKASFIDCTFSGNGYYDPNPNAIWLSQYGSIMWLTPENEWGQQDFDVPFEASFRNCAFTDNENPALYGTNGDVTVNFEDCTFSGNTWGD